MLHKSDLVFFPLDWSRKAAFSQFYVIRLDEASSAELPQSICYEFGMPRMDMARLQECKIIVLGHVNANRASVETSMNSLLHLGLGAP